MSETRKRPETTGNGQRILTLQQKPSTIRPSSSPLAISGHRSSRSPSPVIARHLRSSLAISGRRKTRVRQEKVSSRYCSALHCSINGSALHEHAWKTLARHGYRTASFIKIARIPSVSSQCFGRSPLLFLRCHYTTQIAPAAERKSKKMLQYLTVLVFAMVGLTYAAVPMYRRFCQATGYGGTVQRRESVEEKIARHAKDGTVASREITVQFNADVADGMQWKFIPTQREVRVKPGESALAFYTAENKSSKPITGVSTYNVTPMKAAVYFNKIQCFCFEEQRLLPGEEVDMPVFFYIDPEFETDPRMDGINNIILSYTFFKVADD
ncbi:unnamed protein product [Rhodiola kirilowii]